MPRTTYSTSSRTSLFPLPNNKSPNSQLQFMSKADVSPIDELRLALIGNNDLKLKLLHDGNFQDWLSSQLHQTVRSLVRSGPGGDNSAVSAESEPNVKCTVESEWPPFGSGSALTELQKQVVILRLLVKHSDKHDTAPVSSQNQNQNQSSNQSQFSSLSALAPALPHLSTLTKYVSEAYVSQLLSPQDPATAQAWATLQPIMADVFHIVLSFANASSQLTALVDLEVFWKYLVDTVQLLNGAASSKVAYFSVHAIFNLVPMLLEASPEQLSAKYAPLLLSGTLEKLSAEFGAIYTFFFVKSDFPSSSSSANSSNMVPDKKLLQENFNLNLISTLVVGAAQILNFFKKTTGPLALSDDHSKFFGVTENYHCMLFLIYFDDSIVLNIATLDLFYFHLLALSQNSQSDESQVYTVFERLFPRVIELLDQENSFALPIPKYLQLPVTVLSDLCLKYPKICAHLRNTNVDLKIMKDLSEMFATTSIFNQLHQLKMSSRSEKKLADFTILKKTLGSANDDFGRNSVKLSIISDYLLLLSVFTSTSEEFRRRIATYSAEKSNKSTPNFLCLMIYEVLENFHFLSSQVFLSYQLFQKLKGMPKSAATDKLMKWLGSNIIVLLTLIEHPIFSNNFFLLRSLTRSVSSLRTFFVDCNSIRSTFEYTEGSAETDSQSKSNIIDSVASRFDTDAPFNKKDNLISLLLEAMGKVEDLNHVMSYFSCIKTSDPSHDINTRKDLCAKKVVILASLANFILEFSSFRYEIVNHDSFFKDLAYLLQRSIEAKNECDRKGTENQDMRDVAFEHLKVQNGVLHVIKNYLYNENEENKKVVWDHIPLSVIFEMSLYGVSSVPAEDVELHEIQLEQKVISFELLRNLTAASVFFSEAISDLYVDFYMQRVNKRSVPATWNDYLVQNLLSLDLFLDHNQYPEVEDLEHRFFEDDEFFLRLISKPPYKRMVVAIDYLEDHRYTHISTFLKSYFPDKGLLNVWKRILSIKVSRPLENTVCGSDVKEQVRLSNDLTDVKLSVIWSLINLTYKDDNFGYQMPEKTNFHLFDTVVSGSSANSNNNLFSVSNIVIEESDEEEDAEDPSAHEREVEFSPEIRAKLIYKHGFAKILQRLLYDMSVPRVRKSQSGRSSFERFDILGANDLFEKCKTLHCQLLGLVSKSQPERVKHLHGPNVENSHPLRRMSNIVSNTEGSRIRRELDHNGSDDDTTHARSGQSFDADDNSEEFDEYWVR